MHYPDPLLYNLAHNILITFSIKALPISSDLDWCVSTVIK